KEIVESIYAIKEEVLGVIDERIAQLEIAIDDQFDRYKYIAYSTYDDDSNKNRLQQLEKINGVSSLDSSVRSRLINLVKKEEYEVSSYTIKVDGDAVSSSLDQLKSDLEEFEEVLLDLVQTSLLAKDHLKGKSYSKLFESVDHLV